MAVQEEGWIAAKWGASGKEVFQNQYCDNCKTAVAPQCPEGETQVLHKDLLVWRAPFRRNPALLMYCHRNIDDTYVTSSRLLPGFFRAESFLICSSGRITRFTPRPEFQSFPSPLKHEHVPEHTKRPNGPFGNTDIGPKRASEK